MSDYQTTGPGALGPSGAPSWSGRARGPFELSSDNIIRAAHDAIVMVDEEQRIVMINPAAQRLFGCSASDALGTSLSRFIPEQYRKAHAQHVRDFDASGTAERAMGTRSSIVGLRANGQEFPAEATISRIDVSTEFGPRRYFTALLRDLTEMRGLQAEVDALQQRMRAVFDLAPIAIWITDGDDIVFANRACTALFGADNHAALLGRSIYSLLHPQSHEAMRETLALVLETEQPIPIRSERIARLDGGVRDVEIAVAPLPDHHRTTLQMVITDVTQRVQEKEQIERSRQQLRQLSASMVDAREEERRRIAREMHDELGQRLTSLHMDLSELRKGHGDCASDARVVSMLEMVDETIATVRRITTDLRPLMLDDLGLNAAIEWLANGWSRRMGVAVALKLGQEDPPVDGATTIALYRMVQEALTNIARHAQASKVAIDLRRDGNTLLLTVEDNGTGFTEQAMFRAGSHGLLGIRERAYMLGGTLEIGNAARGGGRLTVQLPLDRSRRLSGDGEPAPAGSGDPNPLDTARNPA